MKPNNSDVVLLSPLDVLELESNTEYISTGCSGIDQILGGGIELGKITEVYGQFSSGKTQLMHTLLSNLDPKHKALVIDTENTFSAKRLKQICGDKKFQKVAKSITLVQTKSTQDMLAAITEADKLCKKTNIKLIIIEQCQ